MPIRGKQHFHYVVAYKTDGVTNRGNPKDVWLTFDCGHERVTGYSTHIAILTFQLNKMVPDLAKQSKLTKDALPRMQCYHCARGEPHVEAYAVDVDKLIADINAASKRWKEVSK